MALDVAPAGLAALRSITHRISTTKPNQLPRVIASQISCLKDCEQLLSQSRSAAQARAEAGVVVHRFFTQIAALLQGRLLEERWVAAVLIKATVEAGGFEVLTKCKHWVAGLLSNLRRPDPPSTKAIYTTTLTRIFVLTWPYPSLVREVTTPSLSPFIKACLSNITGPLYYELEVKTTLECLSTLLAHHTTTFRSHVQDIRQLTDRLLGISDDFIFRNDKETVRTVSTQVHAAAARLAVLTSATEPKQGGAAASEQAQRNLLERAHRSLDVVFFDIEEQMGGDGQSRSSKSATASYMRQQATQARYSAIERNAERVENVLQAIIAHYELGIGSVATLLVGETFQLLQRVSSIRTSPSSAEPAFGSTTTVDERDFCLAILPRLHVHAMDVMSQMILTLSEPAEGLAAASLPLLLGIFYEESHLLEIRRATYIALQTILPRAGQCAGKETVDELGKVIRSCCTDVLPDKRSHIDQNKANGTSAGAEQLLKGHKIQDQQIEPASDLQQSAARLLPTLYTAVPQGLLPRSICSLMDRTAVLTQNKDALLASVVHPAESEEGRSAQSLLPFLVREHPDDISTETLLRPRMPVLQSGQVAALVLPEEQDDDEEMRDTGFADSGAMETSAIDDVPAESASLSSAATPNSTSALRKRSVDDNGGMVDKSTPKRVRFSDDIGHRDGDDHAGVESTLPSVMEAASLPTIMTGLREAPSAVPLESPSLSSAEGLIAANQLTDAPAGSGGGIPTAATSDTGVTAPGSATGMGTTGAPTTAVGDPVLDDDDDDEEEIPQLNMDYTDSEEEDEDEDAEASLDAAADG